MTSIKYQIEENRKNILKSSFRHQSSTPDMSFPSAQSVPSLEQDVAQDHPGAPSTSLTQAALAHSKFQT